VMKGHESAPRALAIHPNGRYAVSSCGFRNDRQVLLWDLEESIWVWLVASPIRSGALACGTVEARLCLDRGILTRVEFGGDFLGALPASGLASRLTGVRFDRTALQELEIFTDALPATLILVK